MKRFLFIFLFLSGASIAFGQQQNFFQDNRSVMWDINSLDTVVFDLSGISNWGDHILVPVYFNSDDTVYSIDFSMKFNLSLITYDSIIVNHPGVYHAANFNWGDSTLYFTSYCMQPLPHDTPVISAKFNLLSYPISDSDFNNVLAYLNGDACSYKIIPPPLNVNIHEAATVKSFVSIYPNPAGNILNVVSSENVNVQLMNIEGTIVFAQMTIVAGEEQEINTANFSAGVYVLRIFNDNFVSTKKVVVSR